jgi:hypothetical protein
MKLIMDSERHRKEFEEVRKMCPWRFEEKCRPVVFKFGISGVSATLKDCVQKNCALFHFKKHFGRK